MATPDLPFPLDREVPDTFRKAKEVMVNRVVLNSELWQRQQHKAVRLGAHPDIIEFERVYVKRLAKLGIPFYAHNMVRTPKEQHKLFLDGVSRNNGSKAYPHRAFAVDVVHSAVHWNLSEKEWLLCGHIGREVAKAKGIDIVWGGDWDDDGDITDHPLFDPAHWQLRHWLSLYARIPEGGYPKLDKWERPYKG